MDIETTWYELSPYLYAIAGVASALNVKSGLSICSGVLLLAAAATIIRMRWVYRRRLDAKVPKAF